MAENFVLVSKSMRPKLGRRSYFTPEGESGTDIPEDAYGTALSKTEDTAVAGHPGETVEAKKVGGVTCYA